MSGPSHKQAARQIAKFLHDRTDLRPRLAMLLGSGHASIANQLKDKVALHGDDVPGVKLHAPLLVGRLEGVPVAVAVLRGFRRIDGKLYAHYLMHDYAFSAGHRGATPPALAAREEDFASRIAAALVDDVDEVLVVGHSSGAAIAVSVLARLVREGRLPGQVVDSTYLWAVSRGRKYPFPAFEQALRIKAAKLNVAL